MIQKNKSDFLWRVHVCTKMWQRQEVNLRGEEHTRSTHYYYGTFLVGLNVKKTSCENFEDRCVNPMLSLLAENLPAPLDNEVSDR